MGKVKPKKDEETPGYRQFVEPPLIPGKPAFYRWIGYFDVPPDKIEEIRKTLTPIDLETVAGLADFDPDALFADSDDSKER